VGFGDVGRVHEEVGTDQSDIGLKKKGTWTSETPAALHREPEIVIECPR
jgi:hypothetical protein